VTFLFGVNATTKIIEVFMLTARIFASSQDSTFPVAPTCCSGNGGEEAAPLLKTRPSKRHLLTSTIFVLLFLSGASSVLVLGQTESPSRPRLTQSLSSLPEEENPKPTSSEARAEAKRLYKAGVKYGLAGLYRQAVATFEQAVKLDPTHADAYFSLGHAYSDLRQWEQAIDSLERGLTLKPKDKDGIGRLTFARSMLEREARTSGNRSPSTDDNGGQAEGSHTSLRSGGLPAKANLLNDPDLTKIYRVGPGDVLEVRLSSDASTQPTLHTVTPAGFFQHPELSAPLPGAGLTLEELSASIEADLKRRSYPNVNVVVTVNEYASHAILVSGLVKEPGVKIIKREAIPLYVVVADAQPLPEAENVTVLRHDSNESYVIDLAKPSEMSLLVRPRDVVTLQANPAQFFYVGGEVKSPGEKSFRRGLTLTQAIIAAGGLIKDSKDVRLARDNGSGFLVVHRFKLNDINSGKAPDPTILPGDRITVGK
jgi:protein involved in polysaccharide export with SLBB domain